MIRSRWLLLCLTLVSVLMTAHAEARTWRVEKDGSGDFDTIQAVMEVCADGDSILIGEGRFDNFSMVPIGGGFTEEAVAGITKDNLTFLGTGATSTIIGPSVYYESGSWWATRLFASHGVGGTVIRDMGFENTTTMISCGGPSSSMVISDCTFHEFSWGLFLQYGLDIEVTNADFQTSRTEAEHIWASGAEGLHVQDCRFLESGELTTGLKLGSTNPAEIQGCFFDTEKGIEVATVGSQAIISNMTTGPNVITGIKVRHWVTVELFGNEVHGSRVALEVSSGATVSGQENIFSGGGEAATIMATDGAELTLQNNHIFREGEFAVIADNYFPGIVTLDLTHNYWGSTNPDEIAEWIWDHEDDPEAGARVDYLPIADGAVSTTGISLGGVKALFR